MALALLLGAGALWARALAAEAEGRPFEAAWRAGARISVLVEGGHWFRVVIAPLHHLDPTHVALNALMGALLAGFGAHLLGHGRTWVVFLGGAWLSSALGTWLNPGSWSLGSSGGGYALTGALVAALARHPGLAGHRGRLVLAAALLLMGAQVAAGPPESDRVVHGGGLVFGLLLGLPRRLQLPPMVWLGLSAWAASLVFAAEVAHVRSIERMTAPPATWGKTYPLNPPGWVRAPLMNGDVEGRCTTNGLASLCVSQHWDGGPMSEHLLPEAEQAPWLREQLDAIRRP